MSEHIAEIGHTTDRVRRVVVQVLARHVYVIDGPPAVVGVRCPCGFRNHGEYLSPERAGVVARRHIAAEVAVALTSSPGVDGTR